MSNMKYTPEQHERVRELFAQKRTARQIGLELGIPRYTVISMFRRLGLSQPRPAHWGYRREKTKEIQVGQTVTARISLRRSGPQSPPVIELYVRDESVELVRQRRADLTRRYLALRALPLADRRPALPRLPILLRTRRPRPAVLRRALPQGLHVAPGVGLVELEGDQPEADHQPHDRLTACDSMLSCACNFEPLVARPL